MVYARTDFTMKCRNVKRKEMDKYVDNRYFI